jgi:hypothetical protein
MSTSVALGIELAAELVEVGHLDAAAEAHAAGVRRQLAEDQAQQRGLAGCRWDRSGRSCRRAGCGRRSRAPRSCRRCAKALGDLLQFRHQLARGLAAHQAEIDLPCCSRRAERSRRRRSSRATRPTLRVRRASTPLRIHTSSCASSLSARALASASSFSMNSLRSW